MRDLVAFLDSNIVLEGRPVADLPWHEVAAHGRIRIFIVPQAMEEIDAKKRDGRLGPHARAFNRLIGPSVSSGEPVVLNESAPRLELQFATYSRIPWDDYEELDPGDGDSRIVAQALNALDVETADCVLISHDIKPLAFARGRGMAVHQASDDWLRAPEPSPKDKEIQRLKQQLAEFRKDEPIFEITVDVSDASPAAIYKIAPLPEGDAEELIQTIRRRNPKKPNGTRDPFGGYALGFNDRDSGYDGKYQTYVSSRLPRFVAAFNQKLELLFNQRLLEVEVKNVGPIRADHLVVTIETNQGWINDRVVDVSPGGPMAPTPSPDHFRSLALHSNFTRDLRQPRIGRHEFEITEPARRSRLIEASCEDFRSGQAYVFEGVVTPASDDQPLEIKVIITAKNLRGERVETLTVEKRVLCVDPSDLVDLATLELRQDYPTKAEVERLLGAQQYEEIEWDGGERD